MYFCFVAKVIIKSCMVDSKNKTQIDVEKIRFTK